MGEQYNRRDGHTRVRARARPALLAGACYWHTAPSPCTTGKARVSRCRSVSQVHTNEYYTGNTFPLLLVFFFSPRPLRVSFSSLLSLWEFGAPPNGARACVCARAPALACACATLMSGGSGTFAYLHNSVTSRSQGRTGSECQVRMGASSSTFLEESNTNEKAWITLLSACAGEAAIQFLFGRVRGIRRCEHPLCLRSFGFC